MDFEKIRSSESVKAAISKLALAAPPVEPLRDGRLIAGVTCRITVGTLMLMQTTRNKVFFQDESGDDFGLYDIFEAVLIGADEYRDEIIIAADNSESIKKMAKRFMRGFSKKKQAVVEEEFYYWLSWIAESISQTADGGNDCDSFISNDWWIDAVDSIASEYGWDEEFIIWYMPITRVLSYQSAINARKQNIIRSSGIDSNAIELLQAIKKEVENNNGES